MYLSQGVPQEHILGDFELPHVKENATLRRFKLSLKLSRESGLSQLRLNCGSAVFEGSPIGVICCSIQKRDAISLNTTKLLSFKTFADQNPSGLPVIRLRCERFLLFTVPR